MKFLILMLIFISTLGCTSTPNIENMASKVVQIKGSKFGGTGVILKSSKKGTEILTNDHVCEGTIVQGTSYALIDNKAHKIKKYKRSAFDDLCLVKIDKNLKRNTFLSHIKPKLYTKLINIGHPRQQAKIISEGYYSANVISIYRARKNEIKCSDYPMKFMPPILVLGMKKMCEKHNGYFPDYKRRKAYKTSILIMPGSSGSPLFNKYGQIVGLMKQARFHTKYKVIGYGMAVPLDHIRYFLNVEAKGEEWIKAK